MLHPMFRRRSSPLMTFASRARLTYRLREFASAGVRQRTDPHEHPYVSSSVGDALLDETVQRSPSERLLLKSDREGFTETRHMLFTIAIILLALWALGLVTSTTMGGLVHVLLVVAVLAVLFQMIGGRRSF